MFRVEVRCRVEGLGLVVGGERKRRRDFGLNRDMYIRWTPHPVIVAIRENKDYIWVLLHSYCTTITAVLLTCMDGLGFMAGQPRYLEFVGP